MASFLHLFGARGSGVCGAEARGSALGIFVLASALFVPSLRRIDTVGSSPGRIIAAGAFGGALRGALNARGWSLGPSMRADDEYAL